MLQAANNAFVPQSRVERSKVRSAVISLSRLKPEQVIDSSEGRNFDNPMSRSSSKSSSRSIVQSQYPRLSLNTQGEISSPRRNIPSVNLYYANHYSSLQDELGATFGEGSNPMAAYSRIASQDQGISPRPLRNNSTSLPPAQNGTSNLWQNSEI